MKVEEENKPGKTSQGHKEKGEGGGREREKQLLTIIVHNGLHL